MLLSKTSFFRYSKVLVLAPLFLAHFNAVLLVSFVPDTLIIMQLAIPRPRMQCRMVDGSFLLDQRGPFRTLDELWDEPTPQTA